MWPVSEIGTLIFEAMFGGPIILLKICEIYLQVSSIHTLKHLPLCPSPFFENVQFLPWTNIFVFGAKGSIAAQLPIIVPFILILSGGVYLSMHWVGGGLPMGGGLSAQGSFYPSMHWGRHPPCGQNSWHTLVKILPCHNFVADGSDSQFIFIRSCTKMQTLQPFCVTRKLVWVAITRLINQCHWLNNLFKIWVEFRISNLEYSLSLCYSLPTIGYTCFRLYIVLLQ